MPTTTAKLHKVRCPVCTRSDLECNWAFYVPTHTAFGSDQPCEGGGKGTRPGHSKDGKMQLCFKCGKYASIYARFCPRCDK